MKKDYNLLDYLIDKKLFILVNETKNLNNDIEIPIDLEYKLYKILLKNNALNLMGILPDYNELNEEEMIEQFVEEGIIYNEKIEDILHPNKVSNLIREYYFAEKIYFKYIDLNDKPLDIEALIRNYNKG